MIEALLAMLFGLLIGSFLNVCVYRWPRDLSVIKPRSHCVACEKTIVWHDNIPVVSYFMLGGRCRYCQARISWRYPVVELATGLLWFYWVYAFGLNGLAIKMCVLSALVVGLIFSDLEERILPDEMTLGGTLMALVFAYFVPVVDYTVPAILSLADVQRSELFQSMASAVVGAAVPAFFLWGGGWMYQKVRHREGLGLGDVKLIAMVGAFLGLQNALFTLILGSISGSVIGYSYIKLTGKDPTTYELPFGTFLGAAALVAAFLSEKVLS
jgi:leader peptidase (prepilin peptidase) / N-methyltransferase